MTKLPTNSDLSFVQTLHCNIFQEKSNKVKFSKFQKELPKFPSEEPMQIL